MIVGEGAAGGVRTRHRRLARSARASGLGVEFTLSGAMLAVLWGVFAFGAVYSWAYTPLAGACALTGAVGVVRGRRAVPVAIAIALAAVAVAIGVQLVPVPPTWIAAISPEADRVLARYDLAYGIARAGSLGGAYRHALTIDPARSWLGLGLFTGFGLFLLGVAAILDDRSAARLADAVIATGAAVAIVAMIVGSNTHGLVYGVWRPFGRGAPFGPFVNRNHFAGWMLMAAPLALGRVLARLDAMKVRAKPDWRSRILWLSTSEAGGLILTSCAAAVMAMSVFLSLSRTGVACLIGTLVVFAVLAAVRTGKAGGVATVTFIAAIATLCVVGAATVQLQARFGELQQEGMRPRTDVWRDAWATAERFPLVGSGLNTFGVTMLFFQTTDRVEHYAEAHNDYLQLAEEGGLLIAIPAFALALAVAATVRRRFAGDDRRAYYLRLGAVCGLAAIAAQETAEFSLQMPGNVALFCVVAALALHRTHHRAPSTHASLTV